MRERMVWIALAVLVVGALAIAVSSLRREEREIDVGFQGEARANPLLAAERFLREMGIPARSSGLSVLPGADHAILLTLPGHALDVARRTRLLDWVRAGGHVVATATGPATTWGDLMSDPLLEACGSTGPTDVDDVEEGIPSALAQRGEHRITVAGERRPLTVLIRKDVGLLATAERRDEPAFDAASPPVLVTCSLGEGRVTVLSDLIFTTNTELGERDHARLLWRLVTLDHVPAAVLLVREEHGPSLSGLVFGRGLPLVVALALLALAAALRTGVRFGPLLPRPPRGRRSLLEHVEAVGSLLWRTGRADVLLAAARADLLARASRRRPGLARLSPDARVHVLAGAAGVSPQALRGALEDPLPTSSDAFVQAVHTLQNVRRSL